MHDVIIVGGGPVGLYAAKLCKEAGLDYVLIEEHKEIGRPNHCSGLISANVERFVPINDGFVEHKVRGCILHSKNREVRLTKPGVAAYVVDREKFDSSMSQGLEVTFGARVSEFSVQKDKVIVKTGSGELEGRILLACDGSNSQTRKKLGLEPKETLTGLIATTKDANSSDHVELWFEPEKVMGGFFWKIPRGATTEYGVFGIDVGFGLLEEFFGIKEYEKRAGVINIGPVRSYAKRILLVGDAACQVKPWSGGGVIYGLTCAQLAVKTAGAAIKAGDFSARFLSNYEKEWKKAIGRPIKLGMFYRSLYRHATDVKLDYAFSFMKNIKRLNRLDMDFL